MDVFRKEDLKDLLEPREPPAISIYVPTTRITSDWEADRLRFRAAVARARELLDSSPEADGSGKLLAELEALLADQEFWLRQADGLAVFRAPGFLRIYRLPTALPELVTVAPTFHTRPLVHFLQAPDRFWILALSRKEVALWEGTFTGLGRVEAKGLPGSLSEAVARYVDYEEETFHSAPGAYHGHGAGRDALEWETEAFFRKVDEGLRQHLPPDAGPVILAGVEADTALYRSISRLRTLADETIGGNVFRWKPERLQEVVRPIVLRLADRRIEDALRLWEAAYGARKAEADLSASARLAVAGRVRLILTERDRRIWGRLDRTTGAVEILREDGEDPDSDAVDLLDELAEIVLLLGGDALAVDAERMPTSTGVATILR